MNGSCTSANDSVRSVGPPLGDRTGARAGTAVAGRAAVSGAPNRRRGWGRPALTILVALALTLPVAPGPAAAQEHDGHHGHPAAVGAVHLPTSCSPEAQAHLDRGVALLHSFWWAPAREAFAAAAQADPACGMAHWGTAMTWLDNPIGGPAAPAAVQAGQAAVERARALGAPTQRERDYLAAIAALYADAGTVDFRTRALAYERAMAHLYRTYPDDQEAAVFYALALNVTALPTDKTFANTLEAARILEAVAAAQPDHPAVAHYLIHSYDYPPTAAHGLDAARRYAGLAPAVPHAQHMPSHIFTRLGYWQESIDANRRSLAAAWAAAGQPQPGVAPADALHPMDYLAYAYLQTARTSRRGPCATRSRPSSGPRSA
jgi:hypothetical protein